MEQSQIILIQDLIAKNKTGDAIIEFKKIASKKDVIDSDIFVLMEAEFNILKNNHFKGTIIDEDFTRGNLRISSKLLELIGEFTKTAVKNSTTERKEKEIIIDPVSRQERLGYFAKQLYEEGQYGVIRQKAVLSSFAIPNREPSDFLWRERDEIKIRGNNHYSSSYSERRWFENHVLKTYGKLIIQPSLAMDIAKRRGKNAGLLRLKCLLEFLQSNKDKVDVVISDNLKKENQIIVGNWFFSSANKPTDFGFEDTAFEWQKDLVEVQIEKFEFEFNHLIKSKGFDVYDAKDDAIIQIQKLIKEISNSSL